jgi:long-chain acyl-CoA synthetase
MSVSPTRLDESPPSIGAGQREAKPQNLIALLEERARRSPQEPAARFKRGNQWQDTSWADLARTVRDMGAALIQAGVARGDSVAIFSATRYEFALADLAIACCGAVSVPIYASNTPDELRYILNDAGVTVCIVDDDRPNGRQSGRLARLRSVWGGLPGLRRVYLMDGDLPVDARIASFSELLRGGDAASTAERERRIAKLGEKNTFCILYTSGTTGPPKGVVLSHGNWVYEALGVAQIGLMRQHEVVLLFLPLAHSFAKVVQAAWLSLGFCMAFAESVDKVVDNCGEVHPTCLPAVPRIFEKVYLRVTADGEAQPGVRGQLFRVAMKAFDAAASARFDGKPASQAMVLAYAFAKRVVFPQIKRKLDLRLGGRLELFVSGGAPLARKLAFFYQELGFEILEGYGLTETSAGSCVNPPGKARLGTVGPPFPGTEIRIASDGEILIRGGGVMQGYYDRPADTAEVLEPDGFLHTGDIGELDEAGYLRITDRKKDIIVTAGGKNVAPQNIENELKTFPIISQAMVYGDKRKYLVALLTVNEEAARKLCAEHHVQVSDYRDLTQREPVRQAVEAAIQAINARLPSYETIKKYLLLPREFSQESGELTPTLKVKRKLVTQLYQRELDALYDEPLID